MRSIFAWNLKIALIVCLLEDIYTFFFFFENKTIIDSKIINQVSLRIVSMVSYLK